MFFRRFKMGGGLCKVFFHGLVLYSDGTLERLCCRLGLPYKSLEICLHSTAVLCHGITDRFMQLLGTSRLKKGGQQAFLADKMH
jgi:hypothetical protein